MALLETNRLCTELHSVDGGEYADHFWKHVSGHNIWVNVLNMQM